MTEYYTWEEFQDKAKIALAFDEEEIPASEDNKDD